MEATAAATVSYPSGSLTARPDYSRGHNKPVIDQNNIGNMSKDDIFYGLSVNGEGDFDRNHVNRQQSSYYQQHQDGSQTARPYFEYDGGNYTRDNNTSFASEYSEEGEGENIMNNSAEIDQNLGEIGQNDPNSCTKDDDADRWEIHYTDDGHKYFYNVTTGQSQWQDPREEMMYGEDEEEEEEEAQTPVNENGYYDENGHFQYYAHSQNQNYEKTSFSSSSSSSSSSSFSTSGGNRGAVRGRGMKNIPSTSSSVSAEGNLLNQINTNKQQINIQ